MIDNSPQSRPPLNYNANTNVSYPFARHCGAFLRAKMENLADLI